jgi:hypothetical protein
MSSISRWRSGLTGASRSGKVIVRLLVEEARHALPLPRAAQWRQPDLRPVLSTSTAGALPRERVRSSAQIQQFVQRSLACLDCL